MKGIVDNRGLISMLLALAAGYVLIRTQPFPHDHPLLELVAREKLPLYYGLQYTYLTMLFTTPYFAFSMVFSLLYIFGVSHRGSAVRLALPRYPDPRTRDELFVVVGEVHHPKRPESVARPDWLLIPEQGLYTGLAVIGAIGTGKTSGCMYPFAEQLFAYRASEAEHRLGGLILEVKGDFCGKVRQILTQHGREDEYLEVSLDSAFRYNPLHNDQLDAYALAYGIAMLLNNLFGRSREPFWQAAYTNVVKFVILLYKVLDGYLTFADIYEAVINPELLERKIQEAERLFRSQSIRISVEIFMADPALERFPFECAAKDGTMDAPLTDELRQYLDQHTIPYEVVGDPDGAETVSPLTDDLKRQQFEAVKRWFYHDWMRIDPKLRTSIVEGISVFLSLFDDNPAVKRVFCPPKDCYDPEKNHDGRYGRPLPPFSELIERGAVCALNFPVSMNPGLAKIIGTLMKQDFQRAVLNRIPRMERDTDRHWRPVVFLCDEYHSFATVGENDPSGDEKFFALSRQAKCIPIVATQSISSLRSTLPGESWRTLLQTFRTKIFLALSDDFSARIASEMCGKEEQLKPHYGIQESGQDAGVSMFSGTATAQRATLGTSKTYNLQRDFVFEPKVFSELKNAQSIVLAYDGFNPWPPQYCYLKPYFLDPNISYFGHIKQGVLG